MPIQVTLNFDQFKREALNEANKYLEKVIDSAIPNIHQNIQELIKEALLSSPEYFSLTAGSLMGIFGLPDGEVVRSIVENVANNTKVFSKGGAFNIQVSQDDLSDILGLSGATFTSENDYDVPWLKWLLTAGDSIVIADYRVNQTIAAVLEVSRTGLAIMTKSNKGFRVPPEYSGTESNNWITRSLDSINDDIARIIEREITRRF